MYKSVKELTTEQLDELRWNTFYDRTNETDDYKAESPDDITNETLFFLYEDISFTDDDFFCTARKEVM